MPIYQETAWRRRIAGAITLCRIPCALLLLLWEPTAVPFLIFYLLCGLSDVLDGFTARALRATSEQGAKLDSIADFVFAVVWVVRVVPTMQIPRWIWAWAAAIAAVKVTGAIASYVKEKRLIPHSVANKVTGVLLFLLPLTVRFIDVRYGSIAVCAAATVAAADDVIRMGRNKR